MKNMVLDILSVAGSISSVVGLLMTIGVWYSVRKLRMFYLAKGRIPDLLSSIDYRASQSLNDIYIGTMIILERTKHYIEDLEWSKP